MRALFLLYIASLISCNDISHFKSDVQEKHISKVASPFYRDSLKTLAANFIVKNIGNDGSVIVTVKSSSNDSIINLDSYNNRYESITSILDSSDVYYANQYVPDSSQLSTSYIRNNIDKTFQMLECTSWQDRIEFNKVCKYVLPYRIGNEELENWRDLVIENNLDILDTIKYGLPMLEVSNLICENIRKRFKFSASEYKDDWLLSYSELYKTKKGTCIGFAKLNMYTLRAFGIPTYLDFVPFWGNAEGSHYWNSLDIQNHSYVSSWENGLLPVREFVNNTEYSTEVRFAPKVFRFESYKTRTNCNHPSDIGKVYDFLSNEKIRDVTDEYMSTGSIRVKIDNQSYFKKIALLTVFNGGKWQSVDWGEISGDGHLEFYKVGKQVIYQVQVYDDKKMKPLTSPFLFDRKAQLEFLDGKQGQQTLMINSWNYNPALPHIDYSIHADHDYVFYYWQAEEWQSIQAEVSNNYLLIGNVPSNCLYRIVNKNEGTSGRIFTVQDKNIKWK